MNKPHAMARTELVSGSAVSAGIGVMFFILATMLGAYVRIPVPGSPVPITLQTFFALLSGAVLGRKLGAASQTGYILLGALGLPVFQGYAFGIAHILGPTGGYLFGFIIASFFTGKLLKKEGASHVRIVLSFIAGAIVIYACGVSWLTVAYAMDLRCALLSGVIPFMPVEAVKVTLACAIYSRIGARSRQIFSV